MSAGVGSSPGTIWFLAAKYTRDPSSLAPRTPSTLAPSGALGSSPAKSRSGCRRYRGRRCGYTCRGLGRRRSWRLLSSSTNGSLVVKKARDPSDDAAPNRGASARSPRTRARRSTRILQRVLLPATPTVVPPERRNSVRLRAGRLRRRIAHDVPTGEEHHRAVVRDRVVEELRGRRRPGVAPGRGAARRTTGTTLASSDWPSRQRYSFRTRRPSHGTSAASGVSSPRLSISTPERSGLASVATMFEGTDATPC